MSKQKLTPSKEFRELVGISRPTEHRARANGKLGCYKIGTRIFYSDKHIEDFLARHERPAKTDKRSKLAA